MKKDASTLFLLLEVVTTFVLLLVLAALGWMAAADYLPVSCRALSLEARVHQHAAGHDGRWPRLLHLLLLSRRSR